MTWHVFSHSHGGLFRDSPPHCLGVQSAPAKAACLLRTSAVSVCRCTRSVHTQATSLMPLAPVLCRMPPVCVWPESSHLSDASSLSSVLHTPVYVAGIKPSLWCLSISSVLHTPVCVWPEFSHLCDTPTSVLCCMLRSVWLESSHLSDASPPVLCCMPSLCMAGTKPSL